MFVTVFLRLFNIFNNILHYKSKCITISCEKSFQINNLTRIHIHFPMNRVLHEMNFIFGRFMVLRGPWVQFTINEKPLGAEPMAKLQNIKFGS